MREEAQKQTSSDVSKDEILLDSNVSISSALADGRAWAVDGGGGGGGDGAPTASRRHELRHPGRGHVTALSMIDASSGLLIRSFQ